MIRLEQLTPATNLNPQPHLLSNRWVVMNTIVMYVITKAGRARISVAPKSIAFKKIKPRLMRAEAVRRTLLEFRKTGLRVSRAQADAAYIQTLRADGCDPVFCVYKAVKLVFLGTIARNYWYWRVPKPISSTSGVPEKRNDQENSQN